MKSDKYQKRFYRDWVGAEDLHRVRIVVRETDLQILTDKPIDKKYVKSRIEQYRRDIENYISKDRRFLTTLRPLAVELRAQPIVKAMAEAAKKCDVGPMAAVAGAIAQFLGKDLLRKGYKEVIIENGGDIFLKLGKTRKIGIYAGKDKPWNKLSLKIKPQSTPLGICASSGTIGHSLSFGSADSVIVMAKNAALADAAATACANYVKSENDLRSVVKLAKSIPGLTGIIAIIGRSMASWGNAEFA